MRKFLTVLFLSLILLSCVSIAVTQVTGDKNNTDHRQDNDEEEQSINIGDNQ